MTEWSDARNRIQARVIEDSISPTGVRLTTVEATVHRFVLAELNTHRTFSRNSESSRAVPFDKRLAKVNEFPAMPAVLPAEQRGMSGGSELEGADLRFAEEVLNDIHDYITDRMQQYVESVTKEHRLHKSVLNRYLEPFLWHTVVITATEWEGFFHQRCHEAAQPEIRLAAEAIRDALACSEPAELDYGDWHLPYFEDEDWEALLAWCADRTSPQGQAAGNNQRLAHQHAKYVSSARCARTSYVTQDGKRDIEDDIRLYGDLRLRDGSTPRRQPGSPIHWSPLEHVATPCKDCAPLTLAESLIKRPAKFHLQREPHPGNLRDWFQHRHELDVSPYTKGR